MSVTQDYKILTLTPSEYAAVRTALEEMEGFYKDFLKGESSGPHAEIALCLLAAVQSALAKVRA